MKTQFTGFIIIILFGSFTGLFTMAETENSQKAILSYSLPSKLDWRQQSPGELDAQIQLYSVGENNPVQLITTQVSNTNLFSKLKSQRLEDVYKELVEAKRKSQAELGHKDVVVNPKLTQKSDDEFILSLSGHVQESKNKSFFEQRYYFTPHGFILVSMDWNNLSKVELVKKAKAELSNIRFSTELQ